jgi:hypothetical protein
VAEQQQRFDDFRRVYNAERPHEALGQETPASRYRLSGRGYPARPEEPHYDAAQAVRRVRSNGEIRWGGELIFLSEALVGEPIGIAETADGDWIVSFFRLPLGLIDRRSKRLRPFAPARPGRGKGLVRNTTGNLSTMFPVQSVNEVSGCSEVGDSTGLRLSFPTSSQPSPPRQGPMGGAEGDVLTAVRGAGIRRSCRIPPSLRGRGSVRA